MPSEHQIEAACAAIQRAFADSFEGRSEPVFPLYRRELRVMAIAAIDAANRARAPSSFAAADMPALRALHRARAKQALAMQACACDLTDGFCGPREGRCMREEKGHKRSCARVAEGMLQAIETCGCAVIWEHDPTLKVTLEKIP